MDNLVLTDIAGAHIEHSDVITAFTSVVYNQLKGSIGKVYPDNVQSKWIVDGQEKTIIPDATINCRVHAKKGKSKFIIWIMTKTRSHSTISGFDWVLKRRFESILNGGRKDYADSI